MFALSFESKYDILKDGTYFGMGLTQFTIDSKGTSAKTVALVNWTYSQFAGVSRSKLESLNITNSLCPESMDFIVSSNTKLKITLFEIF